MAWAQAVQKQAGFSSSVKVSNFVCFYGVMFCLFVCFWGDGNGGLYVAVAVLELAL